MSPVVAVGEVGAEVLALELRCPYCEHAVDYKGHKIPADDCCEPRMLEQLTWMTEYLAAAKRAQEDRYREEAASASRRTYDPQEVEAIREQALYLRQRLVEAGETAIRFAADAVGERYGRGTSRHAAAVRVARALLGR